MACADRDVGARGVREGTTWMDQPTKDEMTAPMIRAAILNAEAPRLATAIYTEARHAGLSTEQADILMARALKRIGVEESIISDQRRTEAEA